MKKHYLIYQITNIANNKIYIGKHITEVVDDDYFGSGKLIQAAIKKYGLDKFVKTILFECQNKEEMDLLERYVVTKEFCYRDDTYNINVGGDGGWNYINQFRNDNPAIKEKQLYNFAHCSKQYCHTKEFSLATSNGLKQVYAKFPEKHGTTGKHWKSQKSSDNMKDPTKNKMIGKCWIHNVKTHEFKVWPKEQQLPAGWAYGKVPHKEFIPKNLNHPNLQYTWISKDNEHKYVLKSELDKWLNDGWHKGRK